MLIISVMACRTQVTPVILWQLPQVSGLSLPEQFTLVNAPIDPYDPKQRRAFLEFTTAYAEGHPVLFNEGLMPAGPPASELQMADAESLHKVGCFVSVAVTASPRW
jgi:hypothetical protein